MRRKYWYKTTRYICVLCGKEVIYRERQYIKKPKEFWLRYVVKETACESHFV